MSCPKSSDSKTIGTDLLEPTLDKDAACWFTYLLPRGAFLEAGEERVLTLTRSSSADDGEKAT